MQKKIRILVVDDEVTSTIFLKRLLLKNDYDVVVAYNGVEATQELENSDFDMVLTDWMMPQVDGIELIRRIRENLKPDPYIIMLTALISDGARQHALNSGADDYLAKPIDVNELLERIKIGIHKLSNALDVNDKDKIEIKKQAVLPDFVAVGVATSTGGPPALAALIKNLNKDTKASYFIIQHGPPWMIETFTNRLKNNTDLGVELVQDGMKIQSGYVYVCPGDLHLIVNSDLSMTLDDGQKENFVRPSADPLFRSIAYTFNQRSIALVLTGMGRDGTNGSSFIHKAGGKIIVQDLKSCVAPSMPRSVIEEDIVDFILNIEEIPARIDSIVKEINLN
jgi:two-component system chemotaxis response regulator CheB